MNVYKRTADTSTSRVLPERVIGVTAIALVASIVVQNAAVIVTGAPDYASPITEVFAYHAQNRTAVAISVGLEALNVPLLLGFLAGLHGLIQRRGGAGADFSRLALAAGAGLGAVYALYAVLWNGVVLAAGDLPEPNPTFELLWRMHGSAFALALPALGVTFLGAALAAHRSGLTPSWQRWMGVIAAPLLVVAGSANLAIGDGSALLFVGMPGFAAWLMWLLATGATLLRAR